jgi:hypothetical protein
MRELCVPLRRIGSPSTPHKLGLAAKIGSMSLAM